MAIPINITIGDVGTTTSSTNDDSRNTMNLVSVVTSNVLLFFLIFGMSATVDVSNMKRQLTNKYAIGTGVAMQFVLMPLLGFLTVICLLPHGLTHAMSMTLLVVTSSPGGSYSNWWCSTFNADLALSVAMTSISSLLSIALLPANLFLYTYLALSVVQKADTENVLESLDFESIFITLGIVLAAILFGLAAGYRFDSAAFHVSANRVGTLCGLLLVLFSVFLANGDSDTETNFWNHAWAFYVGVTFPCLAGMVLANLLALMCFRLEKPETVAIAIECCYQNVGIGSSVAVTMFSDPTERAQAIAVPLLYGIIEAFVIGLYCLWAWKAGWTKAPSSENFCVVITKTYEVGDRGTIPSLEDDENHIDEDNPVELPEKMSTEVDVARKRNYSDDTQNTDSTTNTSVFTASDASNTHQTIAGAIARDEPVPL